MSKINARVTRLLNVTSLARFGCLSAANDWWVGCSSKQTQGWTRGGGGGYVGGMTCSVCFMLRDGTLSQLCELQSIKDCRQNPCKSKWVHKKHWIFHCISVFCSFSYISFIDYAYVCISVALTISQPETVCKTLKKLFFVMLWIVAPTALKQMLACAAIVLK